MAVVQFTSAPPASFNAFVEKLLKQEEKESVAELLQQRLAKGRFDNVQLVGSKSIYFSECEIYCKTVRHDDLYRVESCVHVACRECWFTVCLSFMNTIVARVRVGRV